MKTSTLHQSLQAKLGSYAGEHLVTTLRYQDQYGNSVEKPLLDATLDEVAFSIQTLSAEGSAIHRRRSALESQKENLRKMALKGGGMITQLEGTCITLRNGML